VRAHIDALGIERPVIVDLGCGDFRVGEELLAGWNADYVGVDVVPALIEHHQGVYANDRTRFVCADVVEDPLPPGDVCLIRQVFQHLSNEQIMLVLTKLEQYAHVIVTEHYPADEETAIPNLDKAPGADTRLAANSAVYLEKPPFSQRIDPILALPSEPGQIRTFSLVGRS
jgi:SAM-dependent methyltransferase